MRRPIRGRTRKTRSTLIGANVDLLRQVAGELGVKVEVLSSGVANRHCKRFAAAVWTC